MWLKKNQLFFDFEFNTSVNFANAATIRPIPKPFKTPPIFLTP